MQLDIATYPNFKDCDSLDTFCALRPDASLHFAEYLGLKTVEFTTIKADLAEERMLKVRQTYGSEGEVFYFLDSNGNVIGLLKKKTAWYVLLRAIREKIRSTLAAWAKNPSESVSVRAQKCQKRLEEIQKWLGFSDSYLLQWVKLSNGFFMWLKESQIKSMHGDFPQIWKKYLLHTNQSDVVAWE